MFFVYFENRKGYVSRLKFNDETSARTAYDLLEDPREVVRVTLFDFFKGRILDEKTIESDV